MALRHGRGGNRTAHRASQGLERFYTLAYWKVRTGILKETSSETLCSVGVEEVEVQIFRRSSDDVEVTC